MVNLDIYAAGNVNESEGPQCPSNPERERKRERERENIESPECRQFDKTEETHSAVN